MIGRLMTEMLETAAQLTPDKHDHATEQVSPEELEKPEASNALFLQ